MPNLTRHANQPLQFQRQPSMPPMERQVSAQSEPATPTTQSMPFTWSECHSLIPTDAAGVLVRQPSSTAWPVVKLKVQLQLPLLYMAERESWSC